MAWNGTPKSSSPTGWHWLYHRDSHQLRPWRWDGDASHWNNGATSMNPDQASRAWLYRAPCEEPGSPRWDGAPPSPGVSGYHWLLSLVDGRLVPWHWTSASRHWVHHQTLLSPEDAMEAWSYRGVCPMPPAPVNKNEATTGAAVPRPELPDAPSREEQGAALLAAGRYLFGGWGWQTAMAKRIKVSDRTIRRWLSGQDPLGPGAWQTIMLLVKHKETTGTTP